MKSRQTYNLWIPLTGEMYRSLLSALISLATTAGFIVGSKDRKMDASAQLVFDALEPYLLSVDEVKEWPGTQLADWYDNEAVRYLYRLTPEVLEVLLRSAEGPSAWINPYLPEDLHFLRDDGSTVLGTIAKDGVAWLELDDDEYSFLIGELPQLEGSLRVYER